MNSREKVFSEELSTSFDEVLKRVAKGNLSLAHGIFATCPDGGESGWFTAERTASHFNACGLCQERHALHLRAVQKIRN